MFAHPVFTFIILWPPVSALITVIFKPRTPEQYAKMAAKYPTWFWTRIAALLQLIAAAGFDPVKINKIVRKFMLGSVEERTSKRPPPLGLILLVGWLGLSEVACTTKQLVRATELTADNAQCALDNMDLPEEQMIVKCVLRPENVEAIMRIIRNERSARAKLSLEALERGKLEGAKLSCKPAEGSGK